MSGQVVGKNQFWTGQAVEGHLTPSLPSSLAFVSAVWLGFAPFALHYGFPDLAAAVDTNDVTLAVVVGALALFRVVFPRALPALSLVNAALGGWLVVSAFVLDHAAARRGDAAFVNDVVVGLVLATLGIASAWLTYRQRARTPQSSSSAR